MSLKSYLTSHISQRIVSEDRRDKQRAKAETARQKRGAPHIIEYFHQVDDPYSHLMLQVLPELERRYGVETAFHLVPPPPDDAAPDRERLIRHSREDAALLGARAGLHFVDPGQQPDPNALNSAQAQFASLLESNPDAIFREALQISTALWTGETVEFAAASSDDTDAKLKSGDARRNELNHYLGGTIFYEGEWYWGVDRIQYLEDRLRGLGLGEAGQPFIYSQPIVPEGEGGPATGVDLHYYASFRSPYTYIAVDRVKALADAYGANLKIRFVLPMVMRGLTVPRRKGGYIIKDVAREANRIGVPFGKIADPVGKPVERAYSILPWAIEQGRGYEFTRSFLAHVWSKGTDAGSDRGLKTITEEAGLSWDHARKLIGTEDWKPIEDANQEEMLSYGQWGVPSFRVGDVMVWGQDRLWVIENELKRHQAN